jgi:hypothetical protein
VVEREEAVDPFEAGDSEVEDTDGQTAAPTAADVE